jgi:hypothetical protein
MIGWTCISGTRTAEYSISARKYLSECLFRIKCKIHLTETCCGDVRWMTFDQDHVQRMALLQEIFITSRISCFTIIHLASISKHTAYKVQYNMIFVNY